MIIQPEFGAWEYLSLPLLTAHSDQTTLLPDHSSLEIDELVIASIAEVLVQPDPLIRVEERLAS